MRTCIAHPPHPGLTIRCHAVLAVGFVATLDQDVYEVCHENPRRPRRSPIITASAGALNTQRE